MVLRMAERSPNHTTIRRKIAKKKGGGWRGALTKAGCTLGQSNKAEGGRGEIAIHSSHTPPPPSPPSEIPLHSNARVSRYNEIEQYFLLDGQIPPPLPPPHGPTPAPPPPPHQAPNPKGGGGLLSMWAVTKKLSTFRSFFLLSLHLLPFSSSLAAESLERNSECSGNRRWCYLNEDVN